MSVCGNIDHRDPPAGIGRAAKHRGERKEVTMAGRRLKEDNLTLSDPAPGHAAG
jgi:hypothetical protein